MRKKISLEERAKFVKRKLIKKEIKKDSIANVLGYGIVGGVLGFGFLGTVSMLFGGEMPEPELYAINPLIHGLAAFGSLSGLLYGSDKHKFTVDYYDDGLYNDGHIDSKIYDKELYVKALKKEEKSFKDKGYIIHDSDLNKKESDIVYDDGMRYEYSSGRAGRDKLISFRTEKRLKILKSLSK